MKKLLALLLVLTLMVSLAACGGDDKDTVAGDSASTTQTEGSENTGTTDESTGSSDATDSTETSTPATDSIEDTSTPEETSKPTETTKPSDTTKPEHKHSYTSKVTKEATCSADGTKTFTCSCGDTYTEKIAATGHKWGEWKQTTAPSYTAKGEETRTCGSCSATEKRDVAQLTLDNIFKNYPAIITTDEMDSLGFFNSVNDLNAYKVFVWAIGHINPTNTSQDNLTRTYSVSSLNSFTNKYLGRTFDYSLAQKDNGSEKVVYDATAQTVTITYAGGSGGMGFDTKYVGYEQIDDNHFVVTYETNYDAWPTYDYSNKNVVIEIEKVNDNYIITAHKIA